MTVRVPTPPLATVHELPPRSSQLSDSALVARALAGDRAAEEAIYTRHVGYITGLCLRLLGNRDEAADAVQDTFVDVLQQLGDVREPERLRAWIARVAVRKAHRRFRRRSLMRALGLGGHVDTDLTLLPARSGVSAEQAAELQRLGAVLARLPDEQRAAWCLRYVEGQKLEEVAASCGCSLATAKRRIAAAHRVVRTHVDIEELDDA